MSGQNVLANVVSMAGVPAPAYLSNYANTKMVEPLMQPGGVAPPTISLKGGRFHKTVDGETETLPDMYIDVSIVSYIPTVSRVFFAGAYNPQAEATMPDCWSTDGRIPDDNVPDRTLQSETCQSCPNDVKGSGGNGAGLTKACGYKKRLMIIPLDEYDFGDDARVYKLDAPGMSVFGEDDPANNAYSLQSLSKSMAQHGLDPAYLHAVAMRIMFDVRHSVPKLLFQPLEYVQENELQWIMSLIEQQGDVIDEQIAGIVTGAVAAMTAAAPVAQAAAPQPVAQAQAAPVRGRRQTPAAQPQQPVMQQAPAPQPAPVAQPAPAQPVVRRRGAAPAAQPAVAQPEVMQPEPQPVAQAAPPPRGRRAAPMPVGPAPVAQPAPVAGAGLPPSRRSAARAAAPQPQSGALPVVPAGVGLQSVLNQI